MVEGAMTKQSETVISQDHIYDRNKAYTSRERVCFQVDVQLMDKFV